MGSRLRVRHCRDPPSLGNGEVAQQSAGDRGSAKLATTQYEDGGSHKPGFTGSGVQVLNIYRRCTHNRLKYFSTSLKMENPQHESSSKRYNSGNLAAN
ncbi:hypothetical protein [Microcoleus sp. herbarium14]|uniref:hypothetical protein n=1 Tax=Microcoleus sp. herbarium14 TaxID=3055439 RepID=UPI002FD06FD8